MFDDLEDLEDSVKFIDNTYELELKKGLAKRVDKYVFAPDGEHHRKNLTRYLEKTKRKQKQKQASLERRNRLDCYKDDIN